MPGIFDTGIYDTGIFDHAVVTPVDVAVYASNSNSGQRARAGRMSQSAARQRGAQLVGRLRLAQASARRRMN